MVTETPTSRQLDLPVHGMTCGSCSARVERTLAKQEGVDAVEVNLATGIARLQVRRCGGPATTAGRRREDRL